MIRGPQVCPLHIPQTGKFVCSSHGPFVVPSMSCGEDLGGLNDLKVKVKRAYSIWWQTISHVFSNFVADLTSWNQLKRPSQDTSSPMPNQFMSHFTVKAPRFCETFSDGKPIQMSWTWTLAALTAKGSIFLCVRLEIYMIYLFCVYIFHTQYILNVFSNRVYI